MTTIYKAIDESQVTLSELMIPSNSNFSGRIHGGYILSLMDKVAFVCSSKHSGAYCVTASVNRVDFRHPVSVGDLLSLKASINYVGGSSMVVGIRVESQHVQTGEVKHCNSSYFTMVAVDENGKPQAVPGLRLTSREDVRRFARSIRRQQLTKQRDAEFKSETFPVEKYVDLLGDYKVQIAL